MTPHLQISQEITRFAESLLLGIPAGLLLDLFRTLRAVLPHHALLVFLEDALYSFLLCVLLLGFVWLRADTMLRWQYAFGELLGLLLYLLTAGTFWGKLLRPVRRLRQKCVRFLAGQMKNAKSSEKISEST